MNATRISIRLLLLALALGATTSGAWAQESMPPRQAPPAKPEDALRPPDRSPTRPALRRVDEHGGVVAAAGDAIAEIVFHSDHVRLYLYDRQRTPLPVKGIQGTLDLEFTAQDRKPMNAELLRINTSQGEWLAARVDLSRLATGAATATFHLRGLASAPAAAARPQAPPAAAPPRKNDEKPDSAKPAPAADAGVVDIVQTFQIARRIRYLCAPDEYSARTPGPCPTCAAELLRERSYFACPEHPEVAAEDEISECWRCGKTPLRRIVEPAGPDWRPDRRID